MSHFIECALLFSTVAVWKCVSSEAAVAWGYTNESLDPGKWSTEYPDCGSSMQSPIDIVTTAALEDPMLHAFNLTGYDDKTRDHLRLKLKNVGGHTAEVIYDGDNKIEISGGDLPKKYTLEQFHFHWGSTDMRGSEHAIDGHHYPMELHIVHTQQGVANASSHPYGLAVLGYFFEVSSENNTAFDDLLSHFEEIKAADEQISIPYFPLGSLLPKSSKGHLSNYYRYYGSLTTPPCSETVIWTISKENIKISEKQLQVFRTLRDTHQHSVTDVFRPVQKLNHRRVFSTRDMAGAAAVNGASVTVCAVVMLLALLRTHLHL